MWDFLSRRLGKVVGYVFKTIQINSDVFKYITVISAPVHVLEKSKLS